MVVFHSFLYVYQAGYIFCQDGASTGSEEEEVPFMGDWMIPVTRVGEQQQISGSCFGPCFLKTLWLWHLHSHGLYGVLMAHRFIDGLPNLKMVDLSMANC